MGAELRLVQSPVNNSEVRLGVRDISNNGTGLQENLESAVQGLPKNDDVVVSDGARVFLPMKLKVKDGQQTEISRKYFTIRFDGADVLWTAPPEQTIDERRVSTTGLESGDMAVQSPIEAACSDTDNADKVKKSSRQKAKSRKEGKVRAEHRQKGTNFAVRGASEDSMMTGPYDDGAIQERTHSIDYDADSAETGPTKRVDGKREKRERVEKQEKKYKKDVKDKKETKSKRKTDDTDHEEKVENTKKRYKRGDTEDMEKVEKTDKKHKKDVKDKKDYK